MNNATTLSKKQITETIFKNKTLMITGGTGSFASA